MNEQGSQHIMTGRVVFMEYIGLGGLLKGGCMREKL